MNLKTITELIKSNTDEINRFKTEIKKVAPEVPTLNSYTDDDFALYLIQNGIRPDDSDYATLKANLILQYKKRQEYLTNRDYYITLNKILNNLITFYMDQLREPTEIELKTLAKNTGIQENIDKSILYIQENLLA